MNTVIPSENTRACDLEASSLPASVPFCGRTLAEYEAFFLLQTAAWRGLRVLDCPGGASSFTAEARRLGVHTTAVDPLYGRGVLALRHLGLVDMESCLARVSHHLPAYDLRFYGTGLCDLQNARERALEAFLADYPAGIAQGRYQAAALPRLPFEDNAFDLALSGHFLFAQPERFDYTFHRAACLELCRVATGEVRIYPLLDDEGRTYPHLQRLRIDLFDRGITAELHELKHHFLRKGNQMLVLRKA